MSEIQFIVDKLNEPPFSKDLRLVDFDEKSPADLLQVLTEVLGTIDPEQAASFNSRDEPENATAARILSFLVVLKFNVQEHQNDDFCNGLIAGDKSVVYPALYWCLQRLPQLQKRAYLARYLMPVEVPMEFLQDPTLAELHESHRALQGEFKATHKQVDHIRNSDMRPVEVRSEISQLEEEKKQLGEKIAKLKSATANEPGFEEMLDITSRLRKAQEENSGLAEKLSQQRLALEQADTHFAEAQAKVSQLRQAASKATTAAAVLEQLQREVSELTRKAHHTLPVETAQKRRQLQQLEKERSEPQHSREDVEDMEQLVYQLQRENQSLKDQVDKALADRPDSNLSMLRQPAALAASKRLEKEEECERLQEEREKMVQEIQDKEGKVEMMGPMGGMPGGFMSKEEFRQYGAMLREKTQEYKAIKAKLGEIRAESVVLQRTEQILKGRDEHLEEFLDQLEAQKGVSGFRKKHADLVVKSEQTAQVDAMKGQTLEDISTLVTTITTELKARKERLRPLIEELKELRQRWLEVDTEYQRKKGNYEKVAVGLEVERQQLEQLCQGNEEEALREESRYHFLQSLCTIGKVKVQRVRQEERWEKGDGRLLPDFKCYQDLYTHKLRQQEALSKQLRRQQRTIKETEQTSVKQKHMFTTLHALLKCKLAVAKGQVARATRVSGDGPGGGGLGQGDESYLKAMDYAMGSGGRGVGAPNIMTLEHS